MDFLENLKQLLGGGAGQTAQKKVLGAKGGSKMAIKSRMSGGQSRPAGLRSQQQIQQAPFQMFEDNSFQGVPSQMAKQGANFYEDNTFSRFDTPANKFYPSRTNYGVPEDEMIDTSMGYLSPDQFNQGYRGQLQNRGFNPQEEYRNRLRVR